MQEQHNQHSLKNGTTLNHYRIISVLGAGGFGITYLAEDIQLGMKVVIKEYFPNEFAIRNNDSTIIAKTSSERDFTKGKQRFKEEAQVLAKFNHPSIVKILGYFEANQTAYFIMEYEEGMDLSQYMKQLNRPMTQKEILSIIMPILEGLKEVHNYNYLHRDIKPGNILLRNNNSPVLIDFGASKLAIGEASKSITSMLTEGYAPLEQYSTDIKQQGPFTDLYAIGAVIYKMITGNVPPSAQTRSYQLLSDDDDPLKFLAPMSLTGYDKNFLNAIDRALFIKGNDRPQNVQEFQEDIAGRSIYKEKKDEDPEENKKSNKGLIVGLGLLTVLATGVLLFLFSQKQQSAPKPVVENKVQKAKAELNSTELQPTITVTNDKVNTKQPSSNEIENTSNSQWIFPSFENCINNNGIIVDGVVCQTSWEQAKEICKTIGGKVPSLNDFKQIISGCDSEDKTKKACYEEEGLIDIGSYWSSSAYEKTKGYAWNIDFNDKGYDHIDNFNNVSCVATNTTNAISKQASTNSNVKWDENIVKDVILNKLKDYGNIRTYGFDFIDDRYPGTNLEHGIMGYYEFPYSTGVHKVIIAYTKPEKYFDSHVAAPTLSFFEFKLKDDAWVIKNSYVNAFQFGSWGNAPKKEDIKIVELGEEKFGLLFDSSYSAQGFYEEMKNLYILGKKQVKNILSVQITQDDGGAREIPKDSWKATFNFDTNGKNLYDILVHKTGLENGEEVDEKIVYKYNGNEYIKTTTVQDIQKNNRYIFTTDGIKGIANLGALMKSVKVPEEFQHRESISKEFAEGNYYEISTISMLKDNKILLEVREWEQVIDEILLYSNKFTTNKGAKVGMSLDGLLKLYPYAKLVRYSIEDCFESFVVQIDRNIQFNIDKDDYIGDEDKCRYIDNVPIYDMKKSTKVQSIRIYRDSYTSSENDVPSNLQTSQQFNNSSMSIYPYVCYETITYLSNGSSKYANCIRSNAVCASLGKNHFGKYPNDLKAHEAFRRCTYSLVQK